ncbi:MAG: hypothetical protein QOE53_3128, partial [Pseudonocardiales bacterium]|nr:hypothetical protein [Pseudonocardiales bacterium]
ALALMGVAGRCQGGSDELGGAGEGGGGHTHIIDRCRVG